MLDGTEYFECVCGSEEHTLVFTLCVGDIEEKEIYTSVFLNQYRGFFGRLWVAIKYLFGYKCRFGHWDTFILRNEDAVRLRDMCQKLIDAEEKQ